MVGQTSKVNITRGIIWLVQFAQERLRFDGLIGGSGRPEYKDSDSTTCFTNHCHVAQSWPLNHEWLRFSQNCRLSHALISIVSSFHHPIRARSTRKVNSFYTSSILSRYWLILRFSDLRNSNLTSVYLFEASNYMKLIFFPNKHIKIHKIKYI